MDYRASGTGIRILARKNIIMSKTKEEKTVSKLQKQLKQMEKDGINISSPFYEALKERIDNINKTVLK